jgi:type IX secretion system PorP/SprF family membrane protein
MQYNNLKMLKAQYNNVFGGSTGLYIATPHNAQGHAGVVSIAIPAAYRWLAVIATIVIYSVLAAPTITAQGLHFSQINNAPLLINPANTAIMSDDDYRVGMNYRDQYSRIPVPYNTFSAFAEGALYRNKFNNSWLGTGLAFWNDKAGDGNLQLTKVQANIAYHVITTERSMWSMGISAANVTRSVDFSKLTFDSQWDEFSYNNNLPNQENVINGKSSYIDVSAGGAYTYSRGERTLIRVGASVMHLNMPKESFINTSNRLGLRPQVQVDARFKTSEWFILNPSAYYTVQKQASQLVYGLLTYTSFSSRNMFNADRNELIMGVHTRNNDALIFSSGYIWNNFQLMLSYDYTMSQLSVANNGFGAFEASFIYTSKYRNYNGDRATYGCPRF